MSNPPLEAPAPDRFQGTADRPAVGRGPNREGPFAQADDTSATAGWGAAASVARVVIGRREPVAAARSLQLMNHEDGGFDCPGCAWPDDRHGLHLDVCENGLKHVTWEMTHERTGRDFFAAHTVEELRTWPDHALEAQGRLTESFRYDPDTDHYVPVSWDEANELVGSTLRSLTSPDEAAFYTSGRLSNEATFLYQLWVREFGTNNLPDCSNMCHEASGRALTAAIGTGKGTVSLDDWETADLVVVMGVNAASNAPRMLTALATATRRGAQVIHVNPLVEAASRETIIPHEIRSMVTRRTTSTGTMNIQPRVGGDLALLRGVAKAMFERGATDPGVIDANFLDRFTTGLEEYRALVEATPWDELVRQSGVGRADIDAFADAYIASGRTIISWCLGLTQQDHGVDTVREIMNVLLLRGNIGREGAGPCPIRGHSNVQGNRTCGVDNRPSSSLLDRLDAVYDFESPRDDGYGTVDAIRAMASGALKVFVALGGNFALAAPDTPVTAAALRNTELTVQVSTKLNRSHLEHGRDALILPCLARSEADVQATGPQSISVEDSMSMVHLSRGMKEPASEHLRSEPAIIAGMAAATLPDSSTPWARYVDDYDTIRDDMAKVLDGFEDFNRRVRQPLGFRLTQPARERVFLTSSGAAEFGVAELPDVVPPEGRLVLSTIRSHDQWNTTIYSDDDRYRGITNLRTVVFMNAADMASRGLERFDLVDVTSFARDGSSRVLRGYRALDYDTPVGTAAGYMPEMNVLCTLSD
ncbi:MAG: FdhF/YdeP family oxidoreductase, partial [Actinomycetota bacterium]|nr:FdhF/YdeP family oxidoreductase [Actinomycetota bacterium]